MGSVRTSFEWRGRDTSQARQGATKINSAADDTVDKAHGILDQRERKGTTALAEAITAINELAAFTSDEVSFNYTPSTFSGSVTPTGPAKFSPNAGISGGADINTSSSANFSGLAPISIESSGEDGTPPPKQKLHKADTYKDHTEKANAPKPLTAQDTKIEIPRNLLSKLSQGSNTTSSDSSKYITVELNIPKPVLKADTDVEIQYQDIPDIPLDIVSDIDLSSEIDSLQSKISANINTFTSLISSIGDTAPKTFTTNVNSSFVNNFDFIGFYTEYNLDNAVANSIGNIWRRQGFDEIDTATQVTNLNNSIRLIEIGEHNRLKLAEFAFKIAARREFTTFFVESESSLQYKTQVKDPLARLDVIVTNAYATLFEAANTAITSLYSAYASAFKLKASKYLIELKSRGVKLEKWKTQLEIDIMKQGVNQQKAKQFIVEKESEIARAELFNTEVKKLKSDLSLYEAEMEAFLAKAQIARSKIDAYLAENSTYESALTRYKSSLDAYQALTKVTDAENKLGVSKVNASVSEIQKSEIEAQSAIYDIQIEAEQLRAETLNFAASVVPQKFKNSMESVKVAADAQLAIGQIESWKSSFIGKEIESQLGVDHAETAIRYFEQSSEAAARAANNALDASTAIAKTSAMLQETAAKSAGALTSGAYSALSVSSGISGSGSANASDGKTIQDQVAFSDMLNYSESINTTYQKTVK